MELHQKAVQTCIEMLEQRKYKILENVDTHIIAIKPTGNQVVVFFSDTPKFDTKGMKDIINTMNDMDINHSILIYKNDVTSATRNTLAKTEDKKIELFSEEDLQFNITKHRLQPIFERLTEEETIEFKKQFGLKCGILKIDKPISKFYNYDKGDIIRIIRQDGYIYYRIVK